MNEPINETKRLDRLKDGRIVAGVCTGVAAYVGIDATLIRLGFALLTAFGGLGVPLYLCAWIVIPDETDGVSIAEPFVGERRPLLCVPPAAGLVRPRRGRRFAGTASVPYAGAVPRRADRVTTVAAVGAPIV